MHREEAIWKNLVNLAISMPIMMRFFWPKTQGTLSDINPNVGQTLDTRNIPELP